MTSRFFLLSFLAAPLAVQAQETPASPWGILGNVSGFMGQYYFNGGKGAANGYGDLNLQITRSVSPESGFIIAPHSTYTGFRQVNELAGGGQLFQQSLDNSVGAKWVRRFEGGWSFKPRAAVRQELLRDTQDEKWNHGLYDYMRYEGGLMLERKTRWGLEVPWTYQLSYDMYFTHYRNFKSLASQFGSELAAPNPGAHTLDSFTHQFAYRSDFDLPDFKSVWALYSLQLVSYPDQQIVNQQGQYLSSKRSDSIQTLNFGMGKRFLDLESAWLGRIRPLTSGAATITYMSSNQNHFDTDPARLQYVNAYYDYWDFQLTPSFTLTSIQTLVSARLGYNFAYRYYPGRLTQNADASYNTNHRLQQFTHSVFVDVSYPLYQTVYLSLRGNWAAVNSNNPYQQTYIYDYHASNYFAGLEWRL